MDLIFCAILDHWKNISTMNIINITTFIHRQQLLNDLVSLNLQISVISDSLCSNNKCNSFCKAQKRHWISQVNILLHQQQGLLPGVADKNFNDALEFVKVIHKPLLVPFSGYDIVHGVTKLSLLLTGQTCTITTTMFRSEKYTSTIIQVRYSITAVQWLLQAKNHIHYDF